MTRPENRQTRTHAAGISLCGPSRTSNQDAIYYDIGKAGVPAAGSRARELGLFIVCDGLGGYQKGEVASQTAISVIVSALSSGLSRELVAHGSLQSAAAHRLIRDAIADANDHISQKAGEMGLSDGKMGTTVALALLYGGMAYMANVGDSRIYLIRARQIAQITQDHSIAAELTRERQLSPEEFASHPMRKILTRALGVDDEVLADHYEYRVQAGDRLLICSDGLWQAFPRATDLVRLMMADDELDALADQLVSDAQRRDGSDNISALLVQIGSEGEGMLAEEVRHRADRFPVTAFSR